MFLGYEQNSIDEKFVITFPQGFWKSKKFAQRTLEIRLWKVGTKRRFKGSLKVNRQTDKHTVISTYRKYRPIGSMLWKFSIQKQ